MAGKVKFDRDATFKQIIGADREPEVDSQETPAAKEKKQDRVQRSYFLDRDIEKALRRRALEEDRSLTETINNILKEGLHKYLE